jgi:hypothetical protein
MENSECKWNILTNGKWIAQAAVKLSPVANALPATVECGRVSYFDRAQGVMRDSIVLWSPPSAPVYYQSLDMILYYITMDNTITYPMIENANFPVVWNSDTSSWISLTIEVVIPIGAPVYVQRLTTKKSQIEHLIKHELYGADSWRLQMRCDDSVNNKLQFEQPSLLVLTPTGFSDNVKVTALSQSSTSSMLMNLNEYSRNNIYTKFDKTKIGDFLWLWYFDDDHITDNIMIRCKSKYHNNETQSSSKSQYLVSDVITFEYHLSDRREIMQRSVLGAVTKLLIVKKIFVNSNFYYEISLESPIDISDGAKLINDIEYIYPLSLFNIGDRPIKWIKQHLIAHENTLNPKLSSCYLYHAAFALPEQFVYAAEMLCVLMGGKPVTMV